MRTPSIDCPLNFAQLELMRRAEILRPMTDLEVETYFVHTGALIWEGPDFWVFYSTPYQEEAMVYSVELHAGEDPEDEGATWLVEASGTTRM